MKQRSLYIQTEMSGMILFLNFLVSNILDSDMLHDYPLKYKKVQRLVSYILLVLTSPVSSSIGFGLWHAICSAVGAFRKLLIRFQNGLVEFDPKWDTKTYIFLTLNYIIAILCIFPLIFFVIIFHIMLLAWDGKLLLETKQARVVANEIDMKLTTSS